MHEYAELTMFLRNPVHIATTVAAGDGSHRMNKKDLTDNKTFIDWE